MALTVVILGMHRSGTSCLARILQQAKLYLGPEVAEPAACANLEGHLEAQEAVRINDRILSLSGGAWDEVPETVRGDDTTVARMNAFLAGLRAHPVAGWKDPRTTITWPLWRPHVHNYRLVVCLRHPVCVARSLQVREGWPLERGLALWTAYNDRLLQHLDNEPQPVSWFDFDAPVEDQAVAIPALCRRLGLEANSNLVQVLNPFLRHHVDVESAPGPHSQAIYEQLRAQVNEQIRAWRAEARTSGPDNAPADSIAVSINQLSRAHRLQNEAQQQLFRLHKDLAKFAEEAHHDLHEETKNAVEGLHEQLRRSHEVLHQRLGQTLRDLHDRVGPLAQEYHRLRFRVESLTHEMEAMKALMPLVLSCHHAIDRVRRTIPYRVCRRLARWVKAVVSLPAKALRAPVKSREQVLTAEETG
jgi:hypothetical protein